MNKYWVPALLISVAILFGSFTKGNLGKEYTLICKIPLGNASFSTDNLQNIYTYRGSALRKYNSAGKLLNVYDDKSYGPITSVDASDPMKPLVFYKDFPEIVLLDNTLSLNGNPFNPADVGFPLATVACTSHDNGLWLYDAQNFQLVRLDVNLNITEKTGNIPQSLGISLNPDYMVEYNNFVYMNDTAEGILVFDSYGSYYKTIEVKGLASFQVSGENLYYIQKNKLHVFQLKTFMEDVTSLPDSLATAVRVEKNMLYEKYKDTLRVFSIK